MSVNYWIFNQLNASHHIIWRCCGNGMCCKSKIRPLNYSYTWSIHRHWLTIRAYWDQSELTTGIIGSPETQHHTKTSRYVIHLTVIGSWPQTSWPQPQEMMETWRRDVSSSAQQTVDLFHFFFVRLHLIGSLNIDRLPHWPLYWLTILLWE